MTEPKEKFDFNSFFGDLLPEEKVSKKINGVYRGTVVDVPIRPDFEAKVRVLISEIDELEPMWARVTVPMAGPYSGTYFLPALGTEVLLAFEEGNPRMPYVIGCLWNLAMQPPVSVSTPTKQVIRNIGGSQIVLNETPPSITIQSGPTPPRAVPAPPLGPTIELSGKSVTVTAPQEILLNSGVGNLKSEVKISPDGIVISFGMSKISISQEGIIIDGKPYVHINKP